MFIIVIMFHRRSCILATTSQSFVHVCSTYFRAFITAVASDLFGVLAMDARVVVSPCIVWYAVVVIFLLTEASVRWGFSGFRADMQVLYRALQETFLLCSWSLGSRFLWEIICLANVHEVSWMWFLRKGLKLVIRFVYMFYDDTFLECILVHRLVHKFMTISV